MNIKRFIRPNRFTTATDNNEYYILRDGKIINQPLKTKQEWLLRKRIGDKLIKIISVAQKEVFDKIILDFNEKTIIMYSNNGVSYKDGTFIKGKKELPLDFSNKTFEEIIKAIENFKSIANELKVIGDPFKTIEGCSYL